MPTETKKLLLVIEADDKDYGCCSIAFVFENEDETGPPIDMLMYRDDGTTGSLGPAAAQMLHRFVRDEDDDGLDVRIGPPPGDMERRFGVLEGGDAD